MHSRSLDRQPGTSSHMTVVIHFLWTFLSGSWRYSVFQRLLVVRYFNWQCNAPAAYSIVVGALSITVRYDILYETLGNDQSHRRKEPYCFGSQKVKSQGHLGRGSYYVLLTLLVLNYAYYLHCDCVFYPPFASIAKGEVFVLLYVCFFVCSVNDFSATRGPIHAIFCVRA